MACDNCRVLKMPDANRAKEQGTVTVNIYVPSMVLRSGGTMAWPRRPKSLTERGYRKYMAKQKEVTVEGQKFTLQSVSPTWYFQTNDECGMTGGRGRDTSKYLDTMFKNVVISPPEVATQGMAYFDDKDDVKTPEKLIKAIEHFLRD